MFWLKKSRSRTTHDAPTGHKLFNFISFSFQLRRWAHIKRSARKFMGANEHQSLEDSELIEGLEGFENDAREVIEDFGGQKVSSFRRKLTEKGTMDLMFSYSIISAKGLWHFLPAIDDYARSVDSERDCEFPGSFAHAIKNQLRINPAAVIAVQERVGLLSQYLLDHLAEFDQGDDWAQKTAGELQDILDILRRKKSAESGPRE